MIRSMTAFGTAQIDLPLGTVTVELRSVNSRFLDLHFRLPDEFRHVESAMREQLSAQLARGKIEVRASYNRTVDTALPRLDPVWLQSLAEQLHTARQSLPDLSAPRLSELFNWTGQRNNDALDPQVWGNACLQATQQALAQLQAGRTREGERLAVMMQECAAGIADIVDKVQTHLPLLLTEHRERLASKLRDSLQAAFPGGFTHISGQELSERLAQEANLFTLRIDVAEELSRLRAHVDELRHLLGNDQALAAAPNKKQTSSAGKRLDFLFQEMNREANTLGSKAGSLDMTRAAIDLKLLIEQMREQAQNVE